MGDSELAVCGSDDEDLPRYRRGSPVVWSRRWPRSQGRRRRRERERRDGSRWRTFANLADRAIYVEREPRSQRQREEREWRER
ncbi:hypothetical protein TIFTF001_013051 [Ficus carica]|uniref:Uncharacterized protein n=1 Tax=Ficus carica TaxID=3494 RepID=A0AA87ZX09_FICCA|nr:hypothetical protein TIFTF001_013051 [Ficus carica]